jgi:hypothetical protein
LNWRKTEKKQEMAYIWKKKEIYTLIFKILTALKSPIEVDFPKSCNGRTPAGETRLE